MFVTTLLYNLYQKYPNFVYILRVNSSINGILLVAMDGTYLRFTSCIHRLIPIDELSVGQMTVLRKLSLVRLTSLLEMHNASSKVL